MEFKTPYSKGNKFRRLVWSMVWTCFARPFPRSMAMGWKRMLLRAFGAKIAPTAMVYATAHVFQPWLLIMDDYACLAEGVDCYNTVLVRIGRMLQLVNGLSFARQGTIYQIHIIIKPTLLL